MTFLLDNDIPPRIAQAVAVLDGDVKALREVFPEDAEDVSWLEQLGLKGWVLVTADRRILTRPQEVVILKQARVTSFFLGPFFGSLQFWDQAVWFVKHWPRFEQMAQTIGQGTCFVVKANGKMNAISV